MKCVILANKFDILVSLIEVETADFYCTDDLSEFLGKFADIYCIDFGAVSPPMYRGARNMTWELMQLIKHIREHPSRDFYFCLTMNNDFYGDYEEIWDLPNVIKVSYSEWALGGAIKQIINGTYPLEPTA